MKKLEITVVIDQSEKVEELFKKMELLYTFSTINVGDGKCKVYSVLIPDQLVDKVIDEISQRMDLRLKENTVSVYCVEAFVSTFLDRLKEKVVKAAPPSNPLERLVESTERYTRLNRDMVIMALFATLIALMGLFLDNIAIVIGAMLISPLLGPINAFAVNASLGRIKNLIKCQFSILILVATIMAMSAVATLVASRFVALHITPQIAIREQAALTDLLIALILGFAAELALFIAVPEMLVGVAIAVALVPPAAVTGIGLALSDGNLCLGAFILTLVYLLGLQLGSTIMLKVKGVSPRRYYQKKEAELRSAYSIVTLALLLFVIGLVVALV